MTLVEITAALVRTTLATSAATLLAWTLLRLLKVNSPRIHRTAWLLVIAQGWLVLPWTIEIKTPLPPPTTTPSQVSRDAEAERATPAPTHHRSAHHPPLNSAAQTPALPTPFPLAPIAINAWLLGGAILIAINLRRYLQVLRTLPLGSPPNDATWQAEWHAARASAKLRRRHSVDLRITTNLGPLLHWAPWAYFILVPRELWTTLAGPQRQAILRHELAHLSRGDLWKSLAIRALALPQWFNPCAWLAIRRFDEAAEWACDDAAAASHEGPLAFANSLLASAEFAATPLFGGAPAARGALARRIHRLVSPRFKEESKMKLLLVPTLLAAVTLAQVVRIEAIAAETPPLAGEAIQTPAAASQVAPSIAEQQQTFDQLAKEFEEFAKLPYVIEPPDIVSLRISRSFPKETSRKEPLSYADLPQFKITECMHADPHYHLVDMAGCIQLSKIISINIAGMTLKEAEDAIQREFESQTAEGEVKARLAVAQFNSKVYYVIASGHSLGDEVTRSPIPYPIDGKENVAKALATLSGNTDRPIGSKQLATASITLRRPAPNGRGRERVFPIVWNPSTQAPTPLTNHHLQPGDRLLVDFSSPEANATKTPVNVKPPAEVSTRSAYYDPIAETSPPIENKRKKSVPKPPPVRIEVSPALRYGVEVAPPPASERIDVDPAYQIQPYDTFNAVIHRPHRPAYVLHWDAKYNAQYIVNSAGEIRLSHDLDELHIAGKTAGEACKAMERQLESLFPDCSVNIEFVALASEMFTVSIQYADGTEVAAGRASADRLSKVLLTSGKLISSYGVKTTVELHRGKPRKFDQTAAILPVTWDPTTNAPTRGTDYTALPGDRLVVTIPRDADVSTYRGELQFLLALQQGRQPLHFANPRSIPRQ